VRAARQLVFRRSLGFAKSQQRWDLPMAASSILSAGSISIPAGELHRGAPDGRASATVFGAATRQPVPTRLVPGASELTMDRFPRQSLSGPVWARPRLLSANVLELRFELHGLPGWRVGGRSPVIGRGGSMD
jgi:hypothetical protein